jgi:hypothetical protein
MGTFTKILVYAEKAADDLVKKYPNLVKTAKTVGGGAAVGISGAGATWVLSHPKNDRKALDDAENDLQNKGTTYDTQ